MSARPGGAPRAGVLLLGAALLVAALGGPRPAEARPPGASGARPPGPAPDTSPPPAAPAGTGGGAVADTSRRRIGLVLSGGGARGFAHVGVLRVLDDLGVPVHVVSGASMGAVVGALHSIGYGPDQLRALAVERDWDALFSETEREPTLWPWTPSEAERHAVSFPLRSGRPTLPTGLVTGQRVTQLLARLTWRVHPVEDFRRLPVPFVAVATDLETGEAVPLEGGFLPRALRASLAVPSIFTPVSVGERVLIDGGASRNLPAVDARRLGADVLVCSDVTEPLEPADSVRTFLDVLDQTISFRVTERAAEQRELCDVLIRPDPDGPRAYRFDRAPEWIRRGEAAARERSDTLRALARGTRAADAGAEGGPARAALRDRSPRAAPGGDRDRDSVFVTAVRFPGLPPGRSRYLRRRLDLPPAGPVALDRIDREVGRLYEAGLFARVYYRLGRAEDDGGSPPAAGGPLPRRVLHVETAPEGRRELRVGARFDSHRQAAALLTVDLTHTLGFGGSSRIDARLGEQLLFEARQHLRPAFAPSLLLGGRAGYHRTPLELRDPPRAGGTERDAAAEAAGGELFAGTVLGRHGVVGVTAGGEWFETDFEDEGPRPGRNGWLTTAGALLTWDSRDRVAFTRSGLRLDLRVEASDDLPGSDRELVQSWGDLAVHLPAGERWSVRARISAGSTAGDAPPLHRAFFLGGAVPDFVAPRRRLTLPGIAPEQLRGQELQRAELGLQLRLDRDVVLSAGWTGGDALDDWTVRPSEWVHGFSVSAGVATRLGPVRVTVADATAAGGPRFALDAGGRF